MRHHDVRVGIAGGHLMGNHVEHGARGVGQELVQGHGAGREEALTQRLGAVRVQNDQLAALVDLGKEGVKRRVSQIEAARVARQLDANGALLIHGAHGLGACGVNVRQRQHGTEREAAGMACDDLGRPVVEPTAERRGLLRIAKERLRGREREQLQLDVVLVHKSDGGILVKGGQREAILPRCVMGGKQVKVVLVEQMSVHVDGTCHDYPFHR